MQTTIKSAVAFQGVGLHSGKPARLVIHPASAEHGIWFKRSDIHLGDRLVPARWNVVNQTPLCTRIENAQGVSVSTIEHVMAALAGCGVYNALIEIDGPEVPILDGSAAAFVRGILSRGIVQLNAPVRAIEILQAVEVRNGDAWARLEPSETLTIDFSIEFDDAAIGTQRKVLNMSNGSFVRELCDSRTFCRQADVDAMRAQGLALGGTLENAVVVDGEEVLSPGGLRHSDEAVRHKMLDALGDLALAGAPIIGAYTGHRAGHALTNDLLHKLMQTPGAFRMIVCDAEISAQLPGAGVHLDELTAVA
ncbi:UDP-3-O-acyl-N-acetylglucosamine deacetylase [Rhodobacteraceae bacterium LMO-12]|nr:UDP-3-O-acyl-N-acetylglucosamine deacetylase [Rhodobacteraceae bacterium LMO-JJ12]